MEAQDEAQERVRGQLQEQEQGQRFHHPFTPYEIQLQFMRALYGCLEDGKVAVFESPTGKRSVTLCYLLQSDFGPGTVGVSTSVFHCPQHYPCPAEGDAM